MMLIMMMIMTITMVLTMMGMPRDCSLCLCEVVAEQLPEEDRVNPSKDFFNMIHSNHVNNFYSLNSSPSLRCVPSARTSPYVPLQKKTQFCDRSRADKQSRIQTWTILYYHGQRLHTIAHWNHSPWYWCLIESNRDSLTIFIICLLFIVKLIEKTT